PGRHKGRGSACRVDPATPQDKRQHGACDGSECYYSEQAQRYSKSYEHVMFAVSLRNGLPNQDSSESNRTEQAPQNYSRTQFAADYAPPILEAKLSKRHCTNNQRRCLGPRVTSAADE